MLQRLLPAVVLVVAAGCADDNVSIFVTGVISPDIEESSCLFDPGTSVFLLAPGTFNIETDLVLGTQPDYNLVISVSNQLQRRGGSGRAETNGVNVQRTEVTIRGLDGNALNLGGLPNPFSVPAAAYLPPAADFMSPGRGVVSSTIIPSAYATALATTLPRDADGNLVGTEVIVSVKMVGETQGHIDIESDEYDWPVQLCGGLCLFQCSSEPVPYCFPGQDAVSTISTDSSLVLCPDPGT